MKKGCFITLEGIEGCGKSTHARLLTARLKRLGYTVHQTHEPGGTGLGEIVRGLLKKGTTRTNMCAETELLLFAASRAQLVRSVIEPAVRKGQIIISDRFMDSTTAYQGYARGLNMKAVEAINRLAAGDSIPDVTILLDVNVPTGLARLKERYRINHGKPDRIEQEDTAFHRMVRAGYLALARKHPRRIKIVDASGPLESVAAAVWEIVRHVIA